LRITALAAPRATEHECQHRTRGSALTRRTNGVSPK
jgi:hypothetical protein